MPQFSRVDCSRGAPMGRSESATLPTTRSIRLFKVHINSGGYDDGGAYWGIGQPIYCAAADDYQRFVRAWSRPNAQDKLGIDSRLLLRP